MGGKAHSTNDQMVQFEEQQAAQSAQQEADRQARLQSGTQQINQIFGSAGFDQPFYDNYTNAILNYQLPQEAQQYTQAQNKLTYDLARAGTLRSTAAAYGQGLLSTQDAVAQAGIRAGADQQAANLKSNIQNEQQQAINQLYSTEDPNVAANTAANMVAQSQISQPNLNPLGQLFTPLAVGGAGLLNASLNNYYLNQGMNPANPNVSSSVLTG